MSIKGEGEKRPRRYANKGGDSGSGKRGGIGFQEESPEKAPQKSQASLGEGGGI